MPFQLPGLTESVELQNITSDRSSYTSSSHYPSSITCTSSWFRVYQVLQIAFFFSFRPRLNWTEAHKEKQQKQDSRPVKARQKEESNETYVFTCVSLHQNERVKEEVRKAIEECKKMGASL